MSDPTPTYPAAAPVDRTAARRTKKLTYAGSAIALLVPIVGLGMPSTGSETEFRGLIADQRTEYQFGESTLGDVDPASASMNLVLLGLRGIAADMLWLDALKHKDTKNWSQLQATVNSIVKLQPHFLQVWKFQSWNLSYNVSAEFDGVTDRFAWVKKGTKFLDQGIKRNVHSTELVHDRGDYVGKKIGRSDEWRQFRRYWMSDPDTDKWNGGPDRDLNPDEIDNYLVAKETFLRANEVEASGNAIAQRKMMRAIYRNYPWRSQLDYAGALNREGKFDETSRRAWEQGNEEWRTIYGKEEFTSRNVTTTLEPDPTNDSELAKRQSVTLADIADARQSVDKITNYSYWRDRSSVESSAKMIEARTKMYSGKRKLLDDADEGGAYADLRRGLDLMAEIIAKSENLGLKPEPVNLTGDRAEAPGQSSDVREALLVQEEVEIVEDIIKTQLMIRFLASSGLVAPVVDGEGLSEEEVTAKQEEVEEKLAKEQKEILAGNFPLKSVWDRNPDVVSELERAFQQRVGVDQ